MTDTTQVAERDQYAMAQPQEKRTTMSLLPAVDIFEDQSGVTVCADLPGVTKDKLSVNVHDGNLIIEAEAEVPMPSGLRVQHAEVRHSHFARTFSLGSDLDASKIEANLQDGVLKLKIPRREQAQPRRIAITVE